MLIAKLKQTPFASCLMNSKKEIQETSMAKVVRFHELGGPEVLRLEEITFEDPAPGELRLKVGAIGLNRLEVVYRSGGFRAPNKYPAALSGQSPQHNASVTSDV